MDKIIVVDDSQDFLDLIVTTLENVFDVDTATTAKQAVDLIAENDYKAIILDMALPDFTGYYLGQLIRKKSPNVPLAFLTNYDGETTRENADSLHAQVWRKTDFVTDVETLSKKITNMVSEQK